jgi:hypothetical protein
MCANRIPQTYFITDLTFTSLHFTAIHAQSVTAVTGMEQSFFGLQKATKDLNPQE